MLEENKPSKKILNNPFDGKEITDSLGRKIKLRKPDILDRFDLMSALGEDARNPMCVSYGAPILHILTIDGVLMERCMNIRDFRAALKMMGEEGLEAIVSYLNSLDEDLSDKVQVEAAKK